MASGKLPRLNSNNLRLLFFGIDTKIFNRLPDNFMVNLSPPGKRVERGDDGGFRVNFKKSPQPRPRVAAAKTVRAQREQTAGNPRRDLVGHGADVVRHGDERPLLFRQQGFDVGFFWPAAVGCSMFQRWQRMASVRSSL